VTRIHQALSGAGPVDAVTRQALAFRELFDSWGMAGGVHAALADPSLRRELPPLDRLAAGDGDLLLIHYSAYSPRLERLLEAPQRKLLVYHNVTPARYLWSHHPYVANQCALGRDHLPRYARAADVPCAVSAYNARELEEAGAQEVRVVPVLFDPRRMASRGQPPPGDGPLVLAVGRLAPHKRPDLVVRAFAFYQRVHAPDARLLLAGDPLSRSYREEVEAVVAESGARNVTLAGPLPQPDLNAAYAEAAVLLSLSEHEGFFVPLLEAFHFGAPVVAGPAGGMPEVGGDAVLWTEDSDLAVVAELLHLAASDAELRAELARRGRERLHEFAPERTEAKLREAVEAALAL
jgi:glycosyltransferase involved in cell wall biosynthesis